MVVRSVDTAVEMTSLKKTIRDSNDDSYVAAYEPEGQSEQKVVRLFNFNSPLL